MHLRGLSWLSPCQTHSGSILEERAALQAELAGTQPLGAHADVPAQLG
jgi:hypothetical protein